MGRTSSFHWTGRVSNFIPIVHALALGGVRAEERGGRKEGGKGCAVGGEGCGAALEVGCSGSGEERWAAWPTWQPAS